MGIESQHPHFKEYKKKYQRVRDTFDGADAVKEQGQEYLPKLSGQDVIEYDSYRKRAVYYNAVERTVKGLVGAVMRIDPIIDAPDKLKELFGDITNTGISLNDFISYMLSEQILMGRQGILVDRDEERPYLTGYKSEQIVNWVNGRIILKENYRKMREDDPYESEFDTQYRELMLEENRYVVNLWRAEKRGWKIVEEMNPTNVGQSLDEIPFIAVSGEAFNLEPSMPPMLSLADTSLSMYRTSADLEHGRHFTALPTPYVTGIDADSELKIGSGSAWILPDSSSKAGYLEFTGQGLTALETAMEEKRSMMASLGAQLLQSQKNGVESADSIRLRQNAEASTLISIVNTVETATQKALNQMAEWYGLGGQEISVNLNTDFVDTKINNQDLNALMMAWQSGAISHDTFLFNMKRGEILPPDVSIEDEKGLVDMQVGASE